MATVAQYLRRGNELPDFSDAQEPTPRRGRALDRTRAVTLVARVREAHRCSFNAGAGDNGGMRLRRSGDGTHASLTVATPSALVIEIRPLVRPGVKVDAIKLNAHHLDVPFC